MIKKTLRPATAAELNGLHAGTMMEALGIEFLEAGPDFVRARMPVDGRTRQIHGVLHGGASAAFAETLGSVGAHLAVDAGVRCVGVEINANHIASVSDGFVLGEARPIHLGRATQVWDIRIHSDAGRLACVSRLTIAVLPKI